jgi:CHAD domain-containing protein
MGFRFKRKEPVPKGVRRLATERIKAALESLKDFRRAEAVHGVRKDIKKVRAVLRLARYRIPKKAYRRQTDLLRKAADRLAPTRDAYVRGAALRKLHKHFHAQLGHGAIRKLRKEMEGDLADAEKRFVRKKGARKIKELLKRIPDELDHLKFEAKGWETIAPGLQVAYARGREAYLTARRDPSPDHLHDWRKRVKDLWYQVSVLRPMAAKETDALWCQLKTLSEQLGDDHDLYMLQQSTSADADGDGDGDGQGELFASGVLSSLIEQRQRQLQSAALELGRTIYAEKPVVFCRRLGSYWERWRKGAETGEAHS